MTDERITDLIDAWANTMFAPSLAIEYDAASKLLTFRARTHISKGGMGCGDAFLIDLRGADDVDTLAIPQSSRFLDWIDVERDQVALWFGPMRLCAVGCKRCRNAGCEVWAMQGGGLSTKMRHQQLAATKTIQVGKLLWGKGAHEYRQW